MQSFIAGTANTLTADIVARADGTPITSGTVTFYLMAQTGANAGKWFQTSDDSWQATEQSAGTGTHKSDGHWSCSIDAAAWTTGIRYYFYAKESGNLHIPYGEEIHEAIATSANQTSILEDLEDIKGTGFVKDTNSLVNVKGTTPVNVTVETTVVE